jgi:hypothetical protein
VDLATSYANCGTCGNTCPVTGLYFAGIGGPAKDGDSTIQCLGGQCSCTSGGVMSCGTSGLTVGCTCDLPSAANPSLVVKAAADVDFAVANGVVYFGDVANGTINAVPGSGGTATVVADYQVGPFAIASAAGHVVWANQGDGRVTVLPLSSMTATTIATASQPNNVATDGSYVYWVEQSGAAYKTAIDGSSTPTLLTPGLGSATARTMVLSATTLAWMLDTFGQQPPYLAAVGKDGTVPASPDPGTYVGWLEASDTDLFLGTILKYYSMGPIGYSNPSFVVGVAAILDLRLSGSATPVGWPSGFTYDGGPFLVEGEHIYFVPFASSPNAGQNLVVRVSGTGSCYPVPFAQLPDATDAVTGRFRSDGTYLYLRSIGGWIWRQGE